MKKLIMGSIAILILLTGCNTQTDTSSETTYLEKGIVVLKKAENGQWLTSLDTPLISSNIMGLCVKSKTTKEVIFKWCGVLEGSKRDFIKEKITHIEFILKDFKVDENHQVSSMDLQF